MKSRKTFSVEEFKNHINKRLANPDVDDSVKKTLSFTLEDLLHKTGNYKGFNYVYWLEKGADLYRKDNAQEFDVRYPKHYSVTIPNEYIIGNTSEYTRNYL